MSDSDDESEYKSDSSDDTAELISNLTSKQNEPLFDRPTTYETAEWIDYLKKARNDLQESAISATPIIQSALDMLSDALLARMSGSGATCFGIYPDSQSAATAAIRISSQKPDWWIVETVFGGSP